VGWIPVDELLIIDLHGGMLWLRYYRVVEDGNATDRCIDVTHASLATFMYLTLSSSSIDVLVPAPHLHSPEEEPPRVLLSCHRRTRLQAGGRRC